ncbi:MAG: PKD domain-containing protein, partial [Clostridia bacterium]|nr:PKD domain-containing protein [Clostridia bacterium]
TVIQVNGSEVQAGEAAEVPLQIGENNILVTVALPAGEWADGAITLKKEHFIKVNRPNMKNLPLLALRESNQPLDEGSTFRAHYTLELPELVTSMPIQRIAIDRTTADSVVPAPAPDSGGNTPLSLADIWPGIWRGTVDYGDGSGLQVIALREDGSFNLEHRYGVGGDYPVKITLTYEDMGLVSGVQKVKVNYVAPRLMGMVGPPTSYEGGGIFSWLSPRPDKEINEGELLVLEGWVEDPGDNRWNLTVDYYDSMGPLAVELRSDKTFTISHRFYREPVNYIMVKVEDDTGLEDMRGISVAVHNVAPVVEAQLPALAQAGSLFRGAGSFADPGRDSWQGAVNYGDGSGPQPLVLKEDKTFELNHVYMTTGSFTVTVRVEDSDGGVGTASFSVKVKDYLFSLEAGADTSLNEGETLIRGVPVRGPLADLRGRVPEGIVQETKIQRITVDYGDGSAMETLTLGPVHQAGPPSGGEASAREIAIGYLSVIGGLNLNHTYADNGEYTVTVKLTDIDGDVYEDSFTAEAVNVAPTVQVDPVKDLIRGESFTLSGSIADPGADTWTAAIDFGDGGGNRELKLGSDKTFSASHTYNSSGYYTITVTVTDDDGGIGQAGQRVTVRNRGGGISADATLHSLVLAGVTLERKGPDPDDPDSLIPTGETGFDPQWFIYCISPGDPMVTTIIELTAHPLATISIDGVDWDGTPVPVDLASALVILVTAENGTTKTYTVSAD